MPLLFQLKRFVNYFDMGQLLINKKMSLPAALQVHMSRLKIKTRLFVDQQLTHNPRKISNFMKESADFFSVSVGFVLMLPNKKDIVFSAHTGHQSVNLSAGRAQFMILVG